jgi:PHD/YefM family antitoxin component YafN of YafNO toxin-antitoxin module
MKVSTAEFIKNYGSLADKALTEPVTITKNGRDRLVMISAEEYLRLKRRDRRVVRLARLSQLEG